MNNDQFKKYGHELIDWIADFYENIESYPVKSQVKPGEVFNKLPATPPSDGEAFESIMEDFKQTILPGVTHWQHPHFHAYFPANSSYPSILGELLTTAVGAQCMIWETSPAAAELEEMVMQWFKEMMQLPKNWHGCIQDTASTATLVALLSAREKSTRLKVNHSGFSGEKLRIYCSTETHSSIEKAVKIAGIGAANLVKIEVDQAMAMIPAALEKAISEDIEKGYLPCAVVSALGTTGTLAFDPVPEISTIAKKYKVWHHVDAAYAGGGFLLPEFQHFTTGFDQVDSYVFNPHKWLFTNFDCTAYFVQDKEALLSTFEILPEYLKTSTRGVVNDYRDWGIQLGRRFRALKLWMVIRSYGVNGLVKRLREHVEYSAWLEAELVAHPDFEMMAPRVMNMVVFRYAPAGVPQEKYNALNEKLIQSINESGKAFLTHTKVRGNYVIRLVTGQTYLQKQHIVSIWHILTATAKNTKDEIAN